MLPMVGRSVRRKLMLVVLATTFAALAVSAIALVAYDLRTYKKSLLDDLATQANILGLVSASALAFDDPRAAQENLATLRLRPRIIAAAIYTAQGSLFASYLRGDSAEENLPAALPDEGYRVDGYQISLVKRIPAGNDLIGSVYLRARYDLRERLTDYAAIIGTVMLISLAVAFLMSVWLQGAITKPILAVTEVARQVMARRDFSLRVRKTTDDEIGYLVEAFNDMLAEIARRAEALQASHRSIETANQELASQATELKRSNADLEKFAYVASHDLQEPLRMVSGFADLLQRRYRGQLDKDAHEFITYMIDGAARMRRLVDDLLALSRVATRGGNFVEFEAQAALQHTLSNLHVAISESGASITHDPLPKVTADPGQLEQLLQNLIGNALKFHSGQPPRVHVGVRDAGDHWEFSVRDDGIGLDPQYADRIFEIFQRLHAKDEYPGTGIGLAICKKIVERHRGRIWVESEEGKGATFYFTIPKQPSPAGVQAAHR